MAAQQKRGVNHFFHFLIGVLSAIILILSPILIAPVAVNADALNASADCNHDGKLDVIDLTCIKLMLQSGSNPNGIDPDGNGIFNTLDQDAVVDMILGNVLSHGGGGGSPTTTPTPGTPTPTPTPTETCMIFFNQSTVNVTNGSSFQVMVNISNVYAIATGQFDVFYNSSVLNVRPPYPGAGSVNDSYDRTGYGLSAEGCLWQSVGPLYYSGIDIGYGSATANSSCLRILWANDWSGTDSEGDCVTGGDGYGQTGDGWITVISFRAVRSGTSNISFGIGPGGAMQVNQIQDEAPYGDYGLTGIEHLIWGDNVSVNVNP